MGKQKKNKTKMIVIVTAISIIIIYLCIAYYFSSHYFFHTTVNGLVGGGRSLQTVSKLLEEELKTYQLHIIGREELSEYITGEEVKASAQWDDDLNQILEKQNYLLWPFYSWQNKEYHLEFSVQIEETELETILKELYFLKHDFMKKTENAYIGDYDEESNEYKLVEAYQGTYLLKNKVYEAIKTAIMSMETQLDLEEAGCYQKPTIAAQDERLQATWKKMNQMVAAEIVYQFDDVQEILSGKEIHEWITRENYGVILDEEAVAEYVRQLAKKYDTAFRRHPFVTAQGEQIVIESGTYGWWMNRSEETKALVEAIKQGEKAQREPVYYQRAVSYSEHDYGDTYVEINLSKQHLYLWIESELILESDFVSGNVRKGYATPAGIFPITYKERDATLNGTGYSSNVSFWMPFNGGIGMHDAAWRRTFGGTIYETNGSHGCINLPYEIAEEIYKYAYAGMPVICYYDKENVQIEEPLIEQ